MSTMKEKDYADTSLAPVPTPPESPEVLMERVYEDVTDDRKCTYSLRPAAASH